MIQKYIIYVRLYDVISKFKTFIIESEATDIKIASLITGIYEGQREKEKQFVISSIIRFE